MTEQTLGLSLRDRFFALSDEGASEEDKRRYRGLVDGIEVAPTLELDGLALSYHPSARFKAVRFVEAERLDASVRSLFARPSAQLPQLAAVFVDPEEFSYRTFENIVPLDRWLEGIELALTKLDKLGAGRAPIGYTFALQAGEQARRALDSLDSLGLYVAPQNPESRGGQRFIFHAEGLSRALTEALRNALPKRWMKGFSHVNPVFRCNRFELGDAKFRRHVDTPYYDASRQHVSRYTMLIYLTGGRGQPALQLASGQGDDVELERIEALTCVVFRQELEHEGSAYLDGRKVFLRTELIFEDAQVTHDPAIAQTFAKACYLTGESVFAPELARRTHELYERAAAAHWAKVRAGEREAEPYLHKRYRDVEFVTNGHDYWFPKSLALQSCAAIAVLDTLNCKLGGQAFRKLCTTEVLSKSEPSNEWLPALWAASEPSEPAFGPLDLRMLFPPCEQVDESACCPFHAWQSWDATRGEETVDLYERAQKFAKRRISAVPITAMGQEIFLDPEKFVIENGKIHVLSEQALAPVNFAACWNDGSQPANYLDVEVLVEAPHLLVPPILFVEHEHGHHLMLDLFRNSWMVSHTPRAVPVPKLRNFGPADYDGDTWETTPWLDAAARTSGVREVDEDESDEPWWTDDDNAVVRELYPRDDDE